MTQSLGNFIQGQWQPGQGGSMISTDPGTHASIWSGHFSSHEDIQLAFTTARQAFFEWSQKPLEARKEALNCFKVKLQEKKETLALAISKEVGKPLWESNTEVQAMLAKIDISIQAFDERCPTRSTPQNHTLSFIRHKPHGVVAVFGPYNFPGHLPNGHIIPALLAGNVVLFKPSELTPHVAEETVKLWQQSGLPAGVLTLLQGDGKVGEAVANHQDLNGLFFTGSWKTGSLLQAQALKQPGKILALEMGGNNPLIVDEVEDLEAAAYLTLISAYLTTGQRCTCARRLIVPQGTQGDLFIQRLMGMIDHITLGRYSDHPEPFMGPIISTAAAHHLMEVQQELIHQGALPLKPMQRKEGESAFLTPGLLDVTPIVHRADEEYFGPLLQLIRVHTFEEALQEANRTAFGLSASLLCDNAEKYRRFYTTVKAGVLNWNTPTTGASSQAPFGGIGQSGNFRPSAYYAADYCSYPVASLEAERLRKPATLFPGLHR